MKKTSYIFSGFVDNDKIESYESNRERFITKGKGLDFKDAVKKMDEFISNPTVFKWNYFNFFLYLICCFT